MGGVTHEQLAGLQDEVRCFELYNIYRVLFKYDSSCLN